MDGREKMTATQETLLQRALWVVARVWRRISARYLVVSSPRVAERLRRRMATASTSLTGDAPLVVSLTTYGRRADDVSLTIESIGAGRVRPRRLILWVDDEEIFQALQTRLASQIDRGLEIILTKNYGPHTKYFPALSSVLAVEDQVLVTADDDILYPVNWLERLVRAHAKDPQAVHCFRAHNVRVSGREILSYTTWQPVVRTPKTRNSPRTFATGVSGVIYPRTVLEALSRAGDDFTTKTPAADDVWLHMIAVQAGVRVHQIGLTPKHFPITPGSQESRLMDGNVGGDGNDRQIQATYTPIVVERVLADSYDVGA